MRQGGADDKVVADDRSTLEEDFIFAELRVKSGRGASIKIERLDDAVASNQFCFGKYLTDCGQCDGSAGSKAPAGRSAEEDEASCCDPFWVQTRNRLPAFDQKRPALNRLLDTVGARQFAGSDDFRVSFFHQENSGQ